MKPKILWLSFLGLVALVMFVLIGATLGFPAQDANGDAGGVTAAPAVQEFTLQTAIVAGRMVFVGVGGEIDGVTNPELVVDAGTAVRVTLVDGDGMPHDWAVPELGAQSSTITGKGATTEVLFTAEAERMGTYDYYCTVAGHRQAGMSGTIVVR